MLSIGIDTHQKMHYVEIQNEEEKVKWRGQVTNDREGFDELLSKLKTIEKSNNDRVIGIYINPTGNYHIPVQYFLESNGYIVKYVDARVTDYSRKIDNLGKEKSDRVDASVLASTPWNSKKIANKITHRRDPLSGLTRLRESVSENITRITNIIESDLACIFPEYVEMFQGVSSATSVALLQNFTTPDKAVKSGVDRILNVMAKSSKNHYKKEDAQKFIDLASKSIGVPDRDGIYAFRIKVDLERLVSEKKKLKEIENEILKMTENNDDVKRIDGIIGIGPINAASIVSEIGDIEQFDSALKLQSYGGRAPNMTGSGGKDHATGLSKVRNPYLSNAIHQCSISLVNHRNDEFLEIFDREVRKGKKKTQAYIIVGRRLLYHVYSIMKNQKPYRKRVSNQREGTLPLQVKNHVL
ncbi:MAG: IS110 family transposase [Candidatus Thermoplasmatota archaeon]|nr:IS110 family transposase [Candidatus Thermoplasmatota archaeon]